MHPSSSESRYPFDHPGVYRIRVLGYVNEDWSDRFGGMTITTEQGDDQRPVTTLTGLLRDQVSLAGVLETIHESQLSLLSVKLLKGDG